MKKIIFTICISGCFVFAEAQYAVNYLAAADKYYSKGDYYSAAVYYEKYFGQNGSKHPMQEFDPYTVQHPVKKMNGKLSSKEEATIRLAESYRLLHYPAKAEPYYQQALAFGKDKYPLAYYYFGTAERALGKYDEAGKAFTSFLEINKTDDGFATDAKRELLDLGFIQQQLKKDISLYTVNKSAALNDSGANYAPVWVGNDTLLFTSTRITASTSAHKHINQIYQAVYSAGAVSQVAKVEIPQSQDVHQGVIGAMPNGKTIFLTRWTVKDGKKTPAIYTSSKLANGWSTPVALDSIVNTPGYSTQQPFAMPDGKHLLYASNRPGGLGGFDIWCATLNDTGKVVSTANCGAVINSADDDEAPYYYAPLGALVFATNGRTGMGGFDLFYAKGNISHWSEPVNFGYPVNSVKDDIYFAAKGSTKNMLADAIISSDRASACCLDLFSIHRQMPLKKLTGQVVYCGSTTPAVGAAVTIIDAASGQVVGVKTTGNDGNYTLVVEDYKPLKLKAALTGYNPDSLGFAVPADDENVYVFNNPGMCVAKITVPENTIPGTGETAKVTPGNLPEIGRSIVLKNVYFDVDKSDPQPSSYASLDTLLQLLTEYPSIRIEIGGYTDNKASVKHNAKLSQARAAAVVAYLVSKGIAQDRLVAKGYGESAPVAPNANTDGTDNPDGRQKNRRTEFKILSK
jgi:outer membrane protein OmpA-like peptidoglycan-associated protein